MTAITVRLSDKDHKMLQLLCLVTGRSQNQIMTELLHGEVDRVLPGKREAATDPDMLWKSLGIDAPKPSELDKRWAASVIDSLTDDHAQGETGRRAA